jgi:hypothetical protein
VSELREQTLEMLKELSAQDKKVVWRRIVPLGRPKRAEPLEHISARVTAPMAQLLRKLAEDRNTSVAQLCAELIKLGLPALTGQHVHELLEEHTNGRSSDTRS